MNRYPAKPMMDEMAKYGRYGDTMLVHMNPAEVAGIASLVPGGRLTTNPVTGQPEAFLPMLFGALGGALKLGTLGTAALTGVGTAAVTGDLKRGLLAGLTAGAASGIGETLAGVKEGAEAAQLATDTAQTATQAADAVRGTLDLTDATAQLPLGDLSGVDPSVLNPNALQAGMGPPNTFAGQISGQLEATNEMLSTVGAGPDSIAAQLEQTRRAVESTAPVTPPAGPQNFSQKIFGEAENVVNKGLGSLGTTGQLAIAGVGQGSIEQMRMEEQMRRQAEGLRAEGEADLREAYDDLQRGYAVAQPGTPTGLSPLRSEMSYRTPPPMYSASGGQVRMDSGGSTNKMGEQYNPETGRYEALGAARGIARFLGGNRGYGGRDPVSVQDALRGQDVVAPPRDYMPGFEPEFNYFQNLTRDPDGNIVGTPDVPDRSYRPMRQGVISRGQYFDPVLQAPQSNAQMNEYRRTLEKLDPGPLDEASVMGLASEGSVLSPMQQNMFQQYAPLAPFNPAQRNRISELMGRGKTMQEAINQQEFSRSKGYDLDGDGVVTDAEFTQATVEPETPDMSGINTEGMTAEQKALLQQYLDMYDPDTANFLSSMMTGGFGGIFNYMNKGGEAEIKKMPEVGPPPTGGDIPIRTSMMEGTVPDGGIARVPTEFTRQAMPSEQEVSMLAMAVLGQTENPDPIINMFVDKYGPDMFRQVRQMILESVVPNAQTEGMVRGDGSGMDDRVQGMIGKDQPVAVSPGEYIVAADVVSGLGEGSSDAGAKELDKMMDKVRMERNGTTQQAPRIDERKVMPA